MLSTALAASAKSPNPRRDQVTSVPVLVLPFITFIIEHEPPLGLPRPRNTFRRVTVIVIDHNLRVNSAIETARSTDICPK